MALSEIHPKDEMFQFDLDRHQGNYHRALVDYFRAGLSAAAIYRQILSFVDSPGKILDFASGYGRITRFLVGGTPRERLWVSDISAEAVSFQCERLGVHGFVSQLVPEELLCEAQFEVIFVSSLFSHLPKKFFGRWLRKLFGHLTPRGLLVFSTLGEEALLPGDELPAGGFLFQERSEISSLDVGDYGRSWVSEQYVRREIESLGVRGDSVRRIPQGLWHLQDIYLVSRSSDADLTSLHLDRGPMGHVWYFARESPSLFWIGGWAADPSDPEESINIEVSLDGRSIAEVTPSEEIAEGPGQAGRIEKVRKSGWHARIDLAEGAWGLSNILLVKARNSRGTEAVLHLSTLEGLLAARSEEDLSGRIEEAEAHLQAADEFLKLNQSEIQDLRLRLDTVKASRFWKLRNGWFRLKRFLRLAPKSDWP